MEKIWNTLGFIFSRFGFIDAIDIILLAVLIFYFIKFIRERRASKLAIGVVFVFVLLLFSEIFNM